MLLMARTDLGRAIRAVAKEKQGARLMGIDVDHVYAMSFGIGLACLGAAACFLMPAYYVNPQVGSGFVLVAFTIVVLGGMGSFAGALVGGLLVGVVESVGGLYFGESLGQIGIFAIFIAVLLFARRRACSGRPHEAKGEAAPERGASVRAQWRRCNDSAPRSSYAGSGATPNPRLRGSTSAVRPRPPTPGPFDQ